MKQPGQSAVLLKAVAQEVGADMVDNIEVHNLTLGQS